MEPVLQIQVKIIMTYAQRSAVKNKSFNICKFHKLIIIAGRRSKHLFIKIFFYWNFFFGIFVIKSIARTAKFLYFKIIIFLTVTFANERIKYLQQFVIFCILHSKCSFICAIKTNFLRKNCHNYVQLSIKINSSKRDDAYFKDILKL